MSNPNHKEVRHESRLCRQDLDGLSPVPLKKNTLRSYESEITRFCRDHGNLELEELTVDLVQAFLESLTNGRKPQTRKIRFAHLTSFFNFAYNNLSPDFQNPCNSSMLRKLFRSKITANWNITEKAAVDEIIFRSSKVRHDWSDSELRSLSHFRGPPSFSLHIDLSSSPAAATAIQRWCLPFSQTIDTQPRLSLFYF